MTITYIHHSGYLLETEQALLLFDFVEGALPPLDPAKDLFVFVSHRHEDHFSPKIFDLAATHPRIRFILSDDIWQNKVPDHLHGLAWFMDPGKVLEWKEGGGLRVTAFKSTDEGVAFMVETGGYTIYHAGDLNNWRWNGEDLAWNNNMSTNYRRELEKIKASGCCHGSVRWTPGRSVLPGTGRFHEDSRRRNGLPHALLGRFQRHSGTEKAGLQRRIPGSRGRYLQRWAAFLLSGFSG